MKNVRNDRDIKDINLVTIETRNNYLVPEPNYYITTKKKDNLLAIEMKIT